MSGSLRVTDLIYGNFKVINAPTSDNSETYGPGQNAQILKTNGTSVYWSDTAVKALKDQNGDTIDSTYVKLRADNTITGANVFSGTNTFSGQVILSKTSDASGIEAGHYPALIVGGTKDQSHIEIDGNEILAKSNDYTPADLNLNSDGGNVITVGNYTSKGLITTDTNGTVTAIGGNVYAGNGGSDDKMMHTVRARSNSGQIYLYSSGNENGDGDRSLHVSAHGTGGAKSVIKIDTNNNIYYNSGYIIGSLSLRDSEIDAQQSNNGVSALKNLTTFSIRDKNDLIMSRITASISPAGTITSYWDVRNYNGSTTAVAQKGIQMIMDKEGALTYIVSDPQQMRLALGVDGIYYGVCTTGQSDKAKTVTLSNGKGFILTTGATVVIRFTNASAASTMTLNVNGTGAKNLYQYGTALMNSSTTINGWPANAVVMFTYDASLNSGSWVRQYWYNTTEPTNIISRNTAAYLEAETSANGGIGLSRYALSMMTVNQKWSNIAHVAGSTASDQGTAVAKVAATANFLLNSPIFYTTTNAYVAPGGTTGAMNGYLTCYCNVRYSIGTTAADVNLEIQKPFYLIGIPNNDGATFKLNSTQWWTQNPNTFTSKQGKIFIYLGVANTTSNIYLTSYHPIFYHNGTNLVVYTPYLSVTAHDMQLQASTYGGGTTNLWGISSLILNDKNTNYENHRVGLVMHNQGLISWDHTMQAANNTDEQMLWKIDIADNNIVMWKKTTSFRLAYKAADNNAVGGPTQPIYLNNTGQAAVCSLGTMATQNADNYLLKSGGTITGEILFNSNSSIGGSIFLKSGTTIGGNMIFVDGNGVSSILPSHYYHRFYDNTNVYVHYYPPDNTTNVNSYANLRVKNGVQNGTTIFKTLRFGGDGSFTWDGENIPTSPSCYMMDNEQYYYWHKVAAITITTSYTDCNITFLVTTQYGPQKMGILTCHARTNGDINADTNGVYLLWAAATTNINPDDFQLLYTNSTSSCTFTLWVKQAVQYQKLNFIVLNQNNRGDKTYTPKLWTLYTTSGHATNAQSALPSSTGKVISSKPVRDFQVAATSPSTRSDGGALRYGDIWLKPV